MSEPTDRPPSQQESAPELLTPDQVAEQIEPRKNGHASFERHLLAVLTRFKAGDFRSRMPGELTGLEGKIADSFNELLEVNERRASEIARVCRTVGKEGKLKERMRVPGAAVRMVAT